MICVLQIQWSPGSLSCVLATLPRSLGYLDGRVMYIDNESLSTFVLQIAGPPGCGKTQFCIMLSVLATLPRSLGGLDGGVVYIDTESAFSAER